MFFWIARGRSWNPVQKVLLENQRIESVSRFSMLNAN
jgi:hypothetical protein